MITLYTLNKNLVKPKFIYTETFYVSVNEQLVQQKLDSLDDKTNYFISSFVSESEEFPIFINKQKITSSTLSFLDGPFTSAVEDNPEVEIKKNINSYLSGFIKLFRSSGLDFYFPTLPANLYNNAFILEMLTLAKASFFEQGTSKYILPKPVAELDTITAALRTEDDIITFQNSIDLFNDTINKILYPIAEAVVRSNGVTSESNYLGILENQNKIKKTIEQYINSQQ